MTSIQTASGTSTSPHTRPPDRGGRAAAALAATSLILTACVGPSVVTEQIPVSDLDTAEQSGPSQPTDEEAPEGLEEFYGAAIEWEDCGANYECGELEVPMDYGNPDGDVFTLALGKRGAPQASKRMGSLLINPGGPGGSGLQMLEAAGFYFTPELLDHYDIIGFDPRGVGQSSPAVSCLTDAERDEWRGLRFDIETDEGMSEFLAESSRYAEMCAENTGPGLEFIDTVSSASDLDIIRSAVGDEKLNYIGFSYGTFLGATYAELFTDRVGRLVLDGALDPSLTYEEVGAGQALGFDRALRAYLEYCLDRATCPLEGDVDAALEELAEFIDSLDEHPLNIVGDSRKLDADFALSGLIITLYSRDTWPTLTIALSSAMSERDGTALMSLADLGADRQDDGTYTPGTEAFTAINCLDYSPDSDVEAMHKDAAELAEISEFFGPALAYGGATCADWPFEAKRTPHAVEAAGSADILVVGTTRDPATPYEWSVSLDEQLENSVLLTFDGDGHTAYGNGNECVENAVDGFLIGGILPDPETVCD